MSKMTKICKINNLPVSVVKSFHETKPQRDMYNNVVDYENAYNSWTLQLLITEFEYKNKNKDKK